MALTSKGSATKELRILKTMIKSLEGDLMKEKTKYQKASHKRNTENRRLLDEVSREKFIEPIEVLITFCQITMENKCGIFC